ncbi:MAG: dTMP kinase [Phycisphaerae bacterium]|nr:dTMP kinase [Phycisphaerae bacterium]|tara:strand:- start:1865 stop:2521 length:657 start_codon:yes stop_codon:yes gene_type:complete
MQDWIDQLKGRFLVFDGPDGSGKTTQFRRLAAWLTEQGLDVVEVREPGGTSIGEQIRSILLDSANVEMTICCEMLLYMASRSQLVDELITPARTRGAVVLADRFISSTLAYQGTAGGLDREHILSVGQIAVGDQWPDCTIIFDVDSATAAIRRGGDSDRMEEKGQAFQERVRAGYLEQIREDPEGTILIDAGPPEDQVFEQLLASIRSFVTERTAPSS